ncbi:MAG: ThiF family adenylyltransferase [Elusimicrobiota bacterium]
MSRKKLLDKNSYYKEFLNRSFPVLGEEGVLNLANASIGFAGLGGVGGGTAVNLARMGLGRAVLADPGEFDLPDINRQFAACNSTLGRNKSDVYEEILRDINPHIKIKKFKEGINKENMENFIKDCNIVVDGTDVEMNNEIRDLMYSECRKENIFVAGCPLIVHGILMYMVSPEGMSRAEFWKRLIEKTNKERPGLSLDSNPSLIPVFEKVINAKSVNLVREGIKKKSVPTLAYTSCLANSFIANACVNLIVGDRVIVLPEMISLDFYSYKLEVFNVLEI